jgi:hypothetical protein
MEETWADLENSAGGGNFRFSDITELIDTSCCVLGVVSSVAIDTRFYVLRKRKIPIIAELCEQGK